MLTVLIFGILAGLDNLQLSSALGLMGLTGKRRWMLVCVCAFFEVTMPLVGLLIGKKLNSTFAEYAHWMGPLIMLGLGIYILIRELQEKKQPDLANHRWILLMLPFMLSLDNLVAGLGLGTSGYPVFSTSITVGICAGGMCFLGLLVGEKLRSLIPGNLEMFSGIYLIGMAVFLMVN